MIRQPLNVVIAHADGIFSATRDPGRDRGTVELQHRAVHALVLCVLEAMTSATLMPGLSIGIRNTRLFGRLGWARTERRTDSPSARLAAAPMNFAGTHGLHSTNT
jgi:hypothetical protein